MNLLDSFFNYRKQKGYSLILIRFEEGTQLYDLNIEDLGAIRWQIPHIPVVGIEVKENTKSVIEDKILKLKNYVFHREVDNLHSKSYMDVYPGVDYKTGKEQLIERLYIVMPRINKI